VSVDRYYQALEEAFFYRSSMIEHTYSAGQPLAKFSPALGIQHAQRLAQVVGLHL